MNLTSSDQHNIDEGVRKSLRSSENLLLFYDGFVSKI